MNLKEMRAAALAAAQETIEKAKAETRDLTADEQSDVEAKFAEIEDIDAKIDAAKESDALMAKVAGLGIITHQDGGSDNPVKSLGEHFVKSVGPEALERIKTVSGTTVAAPEFKTNTDNNTNPAALVDYLTTFDQTVVRGFRRPVVSDLFGSGSLAGNSVSYIVENDMEGAFGAVAEAGNKPQLHAKDPTVVNDVLKKIAGFLTFSDEMVEDAPFWVSEINNRGLYLLALEEEAQLMNGTGSTNTIKGVLKRSSIQTETAVGTVDDNADALFRAITKVQTATGLSADGIVINPSDYQRLRLLKDANDQYFGGGFFTGQYGNGGIAEQPPLWGLRTIVSAAVAAKTAVVGAFNVGATVYRKGGIRVESTNSHASDFTSNLITTRIEERIALAVRVPRAFVEVTLLDGDESSAA